MIKKIERQTHTINLCIDYDVLYSHKSQHILDKNCNLIKYNVEGYNYLNAKYDEQHNPIYIKNIVRNFGNTQEKIETLTTQFRWDHNNELIEYEDSLGNYWDKERFQIEPPFINVNNLNGLRSNYYSIIANWGGAKTMIKETEMSTLLKTINEKNTKIHKLIANLPQTHNCWG